MSKLRESLQSGKFTYTGEIGPPKGTNIEPVLEEAEQYLKGHVTAVNVTDIQTAVMRFGSMAACHLLLDRGIEPVFQMVCRDRNRLALQSDLLSAYGLGIENVLAITGDHVLMGDHKEAMPVYDLDSVSLLKAMKNLENGMDMGRDAKGQPNRLNGAPKFFKGCVVTPCADEVEPQIIKLEKKVAAGAQFVQTQAVYDPAAFEEFMRRASHIKVPILVGIVVLKSAGMAKYMNKSVPGVQVPERIIKRLAEAGKGEVERVSAQIAGELIRDMKGMCAGAHIMTLGWDHLVPSIVEIAESGGSVAGPMIVVHGLKSGQAKIIDGEAIAAERAEKLKAEVAQLRSRGIVPHLKAIQAGENPASALYVSNQKKSCEAVGIDYTLEQLPETASREEIAARIKELNEDRGTTGIILQMPLPPGVDSREMQALIAPEKDVEGINPANLGRLLANKREGGPCTAVGAFELLLSTGVELRGKNAVVVGHSEIVGKPMALMLLGADCTTTVCHIFTRDIKPIVKEADILVVAAGKSQAAWLRYQKARKENPHTPPPDLSPLITADMIKPGAVVIDIAINRIPKRLKANGRPVRSKKTKKPIMITVGDVDFEGALNVASWITPVPGGVGPMTVTMLLSNTVYRCKAQHGLA